MPAPKGAGIAACQKSPFGLFDKGRTTLSARTHAPCRAGPMCPAAGMRFPTAGRCGHRPLRKDRRVHPHIGRRGRRPAVERSGTNALGVRRPVSAAAPRCKAPLGGAVGAGDWGRGIAVRYRSLRQRYALPPPSQREARGNGFPRQCAHWLGMTGERGGQGRPPLRCATGAPQWTKVSAAQLRTLLYISAGG